MGKYSAINQQQQKKSSGIVGGFLKKKKGQNTFSFSSPDNSFRSCTSAFGFTFFR